MRWAAIIGGAVGVFVVGALILVLLAPRLSAVEPVETPAADLPTWAPPGPEPVAAADPGHGVQGRVDAGWAERTAEATGIPIRALVA
ncbi:MAG TPA: hypothetical protein VF479_02590, partial [Pseudolysinimonas sp.]